MMRMRLMSQEILPVMALFAVLAGCAGEQSSTVCRAGEQQECPCRGGSTGFQYCLAGGASWGPCADCAAEGEGEGEGETVCIPGVTQHCLCAGAREGAQACADDGRRWLDCDCGEEGEPEGAAEGEGEGEGATEGEGEGEGEGATEGEGEGEGEGAAEGEGEGEGAAEGEGEGEGEGAAEGEGEGAAEGEGEGAAEGEGEGATEGEGEGAAEGEGEGAPLGCHEPDPSDGPWVSDLELTQPTVERNEVPPEGSFLFRVEARFPAGVDPGQYALSVDPVAGVEGLTVEFNPSEETEEHPCGRHLIRGRILTDAALGDRTLQVTFRGPDDAEQALEAQFTVVDVHHQYRLDWEILAESPVPPAQRRDHFVGAMSGDTLTVIQLANVDGFSNDLWQLDLRNGSWSGPQDIPGPFSSPCVAWSGGQLYVLGGHLGGGEGATYRYDPAEGQYLGWHEIASPTSGAFRACLALGQEIIGLDDAGTGILALDPHDESIRQLPGFAESVPPYFGAAVFQGRVVLVGGCSGQLDRSLRTYDPATGAIAILGAEEFDSGANLPDGSRLAQAIEYQGQLFVLGGTDGPGEPLTRVLAFDPARPWYDRWYHTDDLPRPLPYRGFVGIRDGRVIALSRDQALLQGTFR